MRVINIVPRSWTTSRADTNEDSNVRGNGQYTLFDKL